MNDLLFRLLAGFLIGVGCILPGVSGGVMAVTFGLYQPAVEALTGFFRNVRRHTAFLLPLAVGGLLGLLMGAEGLVFAMHRWEVPMLFLFLGFILGGVPALWRDATSGGFRLRDLWALLPGLLLLMCMLQMGDRPQATLLSPAAWLVSGCIYALGTVVPGLSASFFLIQMGWYQQTLLAFSRLMFPELFLFAAGFLAILLPGLYLIQWLLRRWHGTTLFCVLGLLAATVIPAIPKLESGWMMLVDLMMLVAGVLASLAMANLDKRKSPADQDQPL